MAAHINSTLQTNWIRRPAPYAVPVLLLALVSLSRAADVEGAKDPVGMKRYEGSEVIGYRAPKFDEFLLPVGPPTGFSPAVYEKSIKTEGLVSRYTYLAPAGRTAAELFRNYKLEFQRLGVTTLYEKAAGDKGWFGPTLDQISQEDQIGQILSYNEKQERVLVGKSKATKPTYYYLFVTSYLDGVIPERLQNSVSKDRALAELVIIAPQQMEENMAFVSAEEMSRSLAESGKVILYGIYFDTNQDKLRSDSEPMLKEIAALLTKDPHLNIRVVGHTDNQGKPDYNLDLSRRRAATVVQELVSKYAIANARLDSFGCGLYAPVASNESEEGRAKNRRVELVKW